MNVTNLYCSACGNEYEPRRLYNLCPACSKPLMVAYDLEKAQQSLTREALASREATLWRYREVLPVDDDANRICLGEGMTPLLRAERLGNQLGLSNLYIKDESLNPTASFKARGMAVAISMAKELGAKKLAVPSAGNAAGALAAYAAKAGLPAFIFMPQDTPKANIIECEQMGASVTLIDGLITDCGKIVTERKAAEGWFDVSTLKEPYRVEGKKTMGYEVAEQMNWQLPDVILYPTGGGTGLIGMWKAFAELEQLGWLQPDAQARDTRPTAGPRGDSPPRASLARASGYVRRPRMVAVQSAGCAPIVRAFDRGERFAELFPNASTIASGIRVPAAVGDFMILDAVRASGGRAIAVEEARIREWMALGMRSEGLAICPETAACIGALGQLRAESWIKPDERVVIFNTGAVQKYPEAMQVELPTIDPAQIPWNEIA
jgi:threonine synthase